MQQLKYQMLAEGWPDFEFHATTNKQATRDRVVNAIRTVGPGGLHAHTIWCDKHLAAPKIQSSIEFMTILGKAMGRWIARSQASNQYEHVVMMFDTVLAGKAKDEFIGRVKRELKATGTRFTIHAKPVTSDLNGQIADYFSWARFRSVEQNDERTETLLRERVPWTDFNIFWNGHRRYW